jgi:enoyl-CoA hydratase/carnithine racemase
MDRKFVFFRIEKNIAIVEMSNEKKKNVLSYDLLFELKNTLQEIEENDEIRTLILSGKGDSFCSGMDVEWLLKEDSVGMRKANRWIQEVFSYVEYYKKPVIAALNGITLGAGLMLALDCDLRIASDNVLLGLPEIKVGIPLFLGGPKILQRYLGIGKIKELSFLGNLIDAHKGMELGLIDKVTNKKELMEESIRLACEISLLSPIALEMLKGSINASYEMSEKALLAYELDSLGFYWGTEDRKEGFKSFLEKRKAHFKGV